MTGGTAFPMALYCRPSDTELNLNSAGKDCIAAASLVESMERRGYYRLNTQNNADARQLMISFHEETNPEEKDEKPAKDLSLDLFA